MFSSVQFQQSCLSQKWIFHQKLFIKGILFYDLFWTPPLNLKKEGKGYMMLIEHNNFKLQVASLARYLYNITDEGFSQSPWKWRGCAEKVFEARNQSYYYPNPVCCSLFLHICTIVGVVKINQIWMKHLALVFDGLIGM